jgi:hypothetical protein
MTDRAWPVNPVIYQVNTWVWLHELGCTLADVPEDAWDSVALPGVDAVWLMGVWERSPAGAAIAARDHQLQDSFREALPDVGPDDNVGSPYCIRNYVVDPHLGGTEGLAIARKALAERRLLLLLDFVPNHVAPDHPWTVDHPERFIGGDHGDLADPEAFIEIDGNVIALGKDPYFRPWQDVVQLNAFDPGMRQASIDTLLSIGDQCDGVRCDMAMLLLNDVFERTWGGRAGPRPEEDFWPHVIPAVKARHPDMLFMAEAYWDLEPVLADQGFDNWYDKRLYDRMEHEGPASIRAHLWADPEYQRGAVRFLENHDEPRAAAAFPPDRLRACAVAVATLPGATLWHEGQFEGRRVRIPVFMRRRPDEPVDEDLRRFYLGLVGGIGATGMLRGGWQQLPTSGWPDNASHEHLLTWCWEGDAGRHVVVVNLSDQWSQGRVHLPWDDLRSGQWQLSEVLDDRSYDFDADGSDGLFVDLGPWQWHVLRVGA